MSTFIRLRKVFSSILYLSLFWGNISPHLTHHIIYEKLAPALQPASLNVVLVQTWSHRN